MVVHFPNLRRFVKDVDLWVYFATKLANVEDFYLDPYGDTDAYELPQFSYKSTSLRNLVLSCCNLNPSANVNWSALVSLTFKDVYLTEGVMEKVLAGCPNLECLEFEPFWGFHRLEIGNVKLRKLIINTFGPDDSDVWIEILAPYIQNLQLGDSCYGIHLRNMPSLVTAVLCLGIELDDEERLLKESSCLKELLYSVAHVENLELGPWCTERLSILDLEEWQPPPSNWKFLKLNTAIEQSDLPGICSFLQSSSDLETLVIDWDSYQSKSLLLECTNEGERRRRFETHYSNCSLLHLKTIKIIDLYGELSENESVISLGKYLLKHASILEKFIIAVRFKKRNLPQDYVKMKQELLSFPRSSPHASVIFSYSKY